VRSGSDVTAVRVNTPRSQTIKGWVDTVLTGQVSPVGVGTVLVTGTTKSGCATPLVKTAVDGQFQFTIPIPADNG